MSMNTPFREYRWGFGVFAVLVSVSAFAQDFDKTKLVSDILETAQARDVFLNDIGFTATRVQYLNQKEQRRLVTRYDQLETDVWRNDIDSKEKKAVIAQNERLAFDANNASGEFNYAKVGEPKKPRPSSHDNVCGLRLSVFINDPALNLTPLPNLPLLDGRRVEGVKFSRTQGTTETSGFLHWLPENDYVLTKVFVESSIRIDGKAEPVQSLIRDDTMRYGLIDNRLCLVHKNTNYGNGRMMVMEISDITDANPNENYYTPEAIGLKTPAKPASRMVWLIALCVGVMCLVVWFNMKSKD